LRRLNLTVAAAAGGTVDTALFLATRRALFRTAPGRAAGSAAFAVLWATLAVRAATEPARNRPETIALAAAILAGNLAMLGVHLRHRIAGPRVFLGAGLAAVAMADTLRRR
jgi:hypothetical protein